MAAIKETERVVIGILINHPEKIRACSLRETDLTDPDLVDLLRILKEMDLKDEKISLLTVSAKAETKSKKLGDLAADCLAIGGFQSALLDELTGILRKESQRRAFCILADTLGKRAAKPDADPAELAAYARERVDAVLGDVAESIKINDVLMESYFYLDKRVKGEIKPCPCGVPDIDRTMGGFFPGEMTILAARPGVGKTAFGIFSAVSVAGKNTKVFFASAEMTKVQIGQRLLSESSGVNGMRLRKAEISDEDWIKLSDGMSRYSKYPIQFLFTREIEEIIRQTEIAHAKGECEMLVVDYLQLLTTKQNFRDDWLRLGYISQELKALANRMNIPVLALAQLNRQGLTDNQPSMDMLRGSGNLEQDADNVILMHRIDKAEDRTLTDKTRTAWLDLTKKGFQLIFFNIAKQRQGMTAVIPVVYNPARMQYVPLLSQGNSNAGAGSSSEVKTAKTDPGNP